MGCKIGFDFSMFFLEDFHVFFHKLAFFVGMSFGNVKWLPGKNMNGAKNPFIVSADVVALFPKILDNADLKAPIKALGKKNEQKLSFKELKEIAELIQKQPF